MPVNRASLPKQTKESWYRIGCSLDLSRSASGATASLFSLVLSRSLRTAESECGRLCVLLVFCRRAHFSLIQPFNGHFPHFRACCARRVDTDGGEHEHSALYCDFIGCRGPGAQVPVRPLLQRASGGILKKPKLTRAAPGVSTRRRLVEGGYTGNDLSWCRT